MPARYTSLSSFPRMLLRAGCLFWKKPAFETSAKDFPVRLLRRLAPCHNNKSTVLSLEAKRHSLVSRSFAGGSFSCRFNTQPFGGNGGKEKNSSSSQGAGRFFSNRRMKKKIWYIFFVGGGDIACMLHKFAQNPSLLLYSKVFWISGFKALF